LNPAAITDFYSALGQFLSYRLALESVKPDRMLYLAVPVDVYQTFFQYVFTQTAVQRYQVLLIVYEITHIQVVNFAGTQMIEGVFDRSTSYRRDDGRLVVKFLDGRIINRSVQFDGQNPVRYI
jgi:XisH protein